MKFLGKDIKAVIFDMDGTMINSTGLWHEIDKKFFAKRGMEPIIDNNHKEMVITQKRVWGKFRVFIYLIIE